MIPYGKPWPQAPSNTGLITTKREIGEDRDAERDRYVKADAELSAYLDLTQRPGPERAEGADRDHLPQPALLERREGKPVAQVGRRDADLPQIPRWSDRRSISDERDADEREQDRGHAEKADVERPDPEIEQVPADQRAAADAVFSFKAEHRHCASSTPERAVETDGILPSAGGGRVVDTASRPPDRGASLFG